MKENKRQKIYRVIMLIIVVAIITFVITTALVYNGSIRYIVSPNGTSNSTTKKLDALLATVTKLIDEKYMGEVNEDELIDGALRGLVDSVGDVYTEYYSKEELEEFTEETLGNFVGIGVYLRADLEANKVDVIGTIKESPAANANIKTGDEVLKVNGTEYEAKDLEEISKNIKGEEGTEVTLTLKRGDEVFDVTVKRGNVHLNYVAGDIIEDNIRIYSYCYI